MPGKNSKFSYFYRDASNYKAHGEAIFSGEFNAQDIQNILGNLSCEESFIPQDVGIPRLQILLGDLDMEDDHVWHEISYADDIAIKKSPFTLTSLEPTDSRDVHTFSREFAQAKWNVLDASRDIGLI